MADPLGWNDAQLTALWSEPPYSGSLKRAENITRDDLHKRLTRVNKGGLRQSLCVLLWAGDKYLLFRSCMVGNTEVNPEAALWEVGQVG